MAISFTSEQKKAWPWIAIALLFVLFLYLLGPVLSPFLAAAILAYALNPAVDWLMARRLGPLRLPRNFAIVLVLLILLTAILSLLFVVVPVMQKEFSQLRIQLPNMLTKLNTVLAPRLHELGIHVRLDSAGLQSLLTEQLRGADGIWSQILDSARIGGIALLGWLATLALIPIVLFYLLQDWHSMLARLAKVVPPSGLPAVIKLTSEVDDLLAQYLRGQIAVMLVLALYYSAALSAVGLEAGLPIGVLTGLLAFIPYLGFGLGVLLAMLAAILQYDSLQGILLVAGVYGIGQMLESFVLTPKLVGERIGLHPLVVIFALLAFGQLFGFVGVLLALPATAILSVATNHVRQIYLASSFYTQP